MLLTTNLDDTNGVKCQAHVWYLVENISMLTNNATYFEMQYLYHWSRRVP